MDSVITCMQILAPGLKAEWPVGNFWDMCPSVLQWRVLLCNITGRHKRREWGSQSHSSMSISAAVTCSIMWHHWQAQAQRMRITEPQFYVANILFIQPINPQMDPNIQMGTRITLVCPAKCFKEKEKTTLGFEIALHITRERKLWEETNRNNYLNL